MKAKKVYEFKTSGEIVSMGTHKLYKKIYEWFEYVGIDKKFIKLSTMNNKPLFIVNYNLYLDTIFDPYNIEFTYRSEPEIEITEFPMDQLIINSLTIKTNKLKRLTKDYLKVLGDLEISDNDDLIQLPKKLIVKGDLKLSGTKISELPNKIEVDERIWIPDNNIIKLPDNLIVNNDLNLNSNPISKLPKNLTVKGNLYIQETNIRTLPEDLNVDLDIFVTRREKSVAFEHPPYIKYKVPKHLFNKIRTVL